MVHRSVLITGAARRLGALLATRLAEEGYRVTIHYNSSKTEAEALSKTISTKGGCCSSLQADLSDPAATDSLFQNATGGPYTLLINNASLFHKKPLAQTDTRHWEETFRLNLFAPVSLTRQFAAQETRGQVINILDSMMHKNSTDFAAYILSRRALDNFTRLAAYEFAPRVRVNGIAPGVLLPPETLPAGMRLPDPKTVPLKRHPDPERLVDTIRYLESSPDITGEIIHLDGGAHLCP